MNATNIRLTRFFRMSLVTALVCFVCCAGCRSQSTAQGKKEQEKSVVKSVSSPVVASVDGVPISAREIGDLMRGVDGGLSEEEALESLINNELLSAEAHRRGYGKLSEVTDVRKRTLAAVLLDREVDKKIRIDTLDDDWLKTVYGHLKAQRYVHSVRRRVVHIVFTTGKKNMPKEKAKEQALGLEARLKEMDDIEEKEFTEICNEVKGSNEKIKVESLPAFSQDDEQFAGLFVEAAFSIKELGRISEAVETPFGWHVIYFAEEIEANNRSFAEVRDELAGELLPGKKIDGAAELMKRLTKDGEYFIHDDALNTVGQGQ